MKRWTSKWRPIELDYRIESVAHAPLVLVCMRAGVERGEADEITEAIVTSLNERELLFHEAALPEMSLVSAVDILQSGLVESVRLKTREKAALRTLIKSAIKSAKGQST